MKIIIDSREQKPYQFQKIDPPPEVTIGTLQTGDYSIEGYEGQVCIERKSAIDLFGSCGKGRDRFEREFKRMEEYRYAAIVIERDWASIYKNPPARSKMDPKNILRTLIAWQMRYGVHVWACPTRGFAETLTYILLKRFYDDVTDGKIKA